MPLYRCFSCCNNTLFLVRNGELLLLLPTSRKLKRAEEEEHGCKHSRKKPIPDAIVRNLDPRPDCEARWKTWMNPEESIYWEHLSLSLSLSLTHTHTHTRSRTQTHNSNQAREIATIQTNRKEFAYKKPASRFVFRELHNLARKIARDAASSFCVIQAATTNLVDKIATVQENWDPIFDVNRWKVYVADFRTEKKVAYFGKKSQGNLGRNRSLREFFSFPIRSYSSIASLSRLADHWSTALLRTSSCSSGL